MLGLVCFVAGTYTVLTTQESAEHHQVDIHPPGIDPIKPVVFHDPSNKENDTSIHNGIRESPVDIDVAKVGFYYHDFKMPIMSTFFIFSSDSIYHAKNFICEKILQFE